MIIHLQSFYDLRIMRQDESFYDLRIMRQDESFYDLRIMRQDGIFDVVLCGKKNYLIFFKFLIVFG